VEEGHIHTGWLLKVQFLPLFFAYPKTIRKGRRVTIPGSLCDPTEPVLVVRFCEILSPGKLPLAINCMDTGLAHQRKQLQEIGTGVFGSRRTIACLYPISVSCLGLKTVTCIGSQGLTGPEGIASFPAGVV
jgi:hypothetical protein